MAPIAASRHDLIAQLPALWRILVVATAYYLAAQVDYFTKPVEGPVSSLWIPAGVAVAGLLFFGHRTWPGIAIGAFLATMRQLPLDAAALAALGNTLAAMCSYLLLRHFQFRTQLDRLRDALVLVFLGSLGAMSISACAGTAALIATGVAPPSELGHVWMVWWSSDALGVLTVTPLLLVVRNCRTLLGRYRWQAWLELAVLLVTTFTVTLVATRIFGFIFLAFPLVLWAAWRFQLVAATPCALLISAIAIDAAAHGYGLFSGRPLLADLAILQVFNASVVLTGLVFSVLIAQWRQSRADIEQTCERLTEVVDYLQKAMLPGRSYFPSVPNLNASPAPDTAKATRTWAIHLAQSTDHLRIRQRDQGTA